MRIDWWSELDTGGKIMWEEAIDIGINARSSAAEWPD